MSNNEIKALILAIIMLSVLIYCIIMAIYFYRFESKKLSIIWIFICVVAAIAVAWNSHIIVNVMSAIYTDKVIAIIGILSALFLVIAFYLMFFYYEKTSVLFFSIAISAFITSFFIF
jgi:hypothetical protein